MTDKPDDHLSLPLSGVRGQLDFAGFTPDEASDFAASFEDRITELEEERRRLDVARLEHRASALEALRQHLETQQRTTLLIDTAVAEARGLGATWQQIADAAGMRVQSAWERWAKR